MQFDLSLKNENCSTESPCTCTLFNYSCWASSKANGFKHQFFSYFVILSSSCDAALEDLRYIHRTQAMGASKYWRIHLRHQIHLFLFTPLVAAEALAAFPLLDLVVLEVFLGIVAAAVDHNALSMSEGVKPSLSSPSLLSSCNKTLTNESSQTISN
jgi:hypothetical protein